jgi:probable rRNA maturation factor
MYDVAIINEQTRHAVDDQRLQSAVRAVLEAEGAVRATVSIAIVDNATIQRLNRDFLAHDCSTDVLSFVLESSEDELDGEIIVSADMAAATSARFGWTTADELLLYVIHGTLHLLGYDDQTPDALAEMQARERHELSRFGLVPRYGE